MPAKTVELLADPIGPDAPARLCLNGLNSGCGARMHPGCLNSDISVFAGPDGVTTESGRIALVDGHHYLQHDATQEHPIRERDVRMGILRALHRARRPLGCDRVADRPAAPPEARGVCEDLDADLRRYVEGYLDPEGSFFAEHRERLTPVIERFFESVGERQAPATLRREFFAGDTRVPERRAFMFNQIFLLPLWKHRWIYDLEELRHAAVCAGFEPEAVNERAFRDSALPQVGALDAPMHNDESVYVEITKS